jgi:hypothetical protein
MKKNYSTPHTRTTAIRTLRLMSESAQGNATTTNSTKATIQLSEPQVNGNAANAASRGSSIWED